MRSIKILLFFLFPAVITNLNAQTNFLKGYYITLKQDTIRGYIEYLSEAHNGRVCAFKSDPKGKVTKFTANDILGYSVDDKEIFESLPLKTNTGETTRVFYKLLVGGKLTLLSYRGRYFARTTEGKIYEVTKRSVQVDNTVKDDLYGLGVLKSLMKGCSEITEQTLEKEYEKRPDFVSLFDRYNRCVGGPVVTTKRPSIVPHVNFGVQVSANQTNLILSGDLEGATLKDESFGAGAFVCIFIPKIGEHHRIIIEASYSENHYYSYFTDAPGWTSNDLFVDYSCLRMPVLFRFGIKHFFFDVGMQNQIILNQDSRWRTETRNLDWIQTTEEPVDPLTNWTVGFAGGVGLQYSVLNRPVAAWVRFSSTKSSKQINLPNYFQTIELTLSVSLTK